VSFIFSQHPLESVDKSTFSIEISLLNTSVSVKSLPKCICLACIFPNIEHPTRRGNFFLQIVYDALMLIAAILSFNTSWQTMNHGLKYSPFSMTINLNAAWSTMQFSIGESCDPLNILIHEYAKSVWLAVIPGPFDFPVMCFPECENCITIFLKFMFIGELEFFI
jgi:hypothetical protein